MIFGKILEEHPNGLTNQGWDYQYLCYNKSLTSEFVELKLEEFINDREIEHRAEFLWECVFNTNISLEVRLRILNYFDVWDMLCKHGKPLTDNNMLELDLVKKIIDECDPGNVDEAIEGFAIYKRSDLETVKWLVSRHSDTNKIAAYINRSPN